MLERARTIYRQSQKPQDNFWNTWVSRPPAAVVVGLLEGTRVTPNQVTFASLAVFLVGAAVLVAWPTWPGLIVAALLGQASYILDCVDGQLARYKGLASPVGALLDFLMDEVKAFLLVGAAAVRLWLQTAEPFWLLLGVAGLIVVATGITLTSFMRRDEYLAAIGKRRGGPAPGDATERQSTARRPPVARLVAVVENAGRFVFHYPSYFLLVAAFNLLDLFLLLYLATHLLYLGRAGLIVLLNLGASSRGVLPAPSSSAEPAEPPPHRASSRADSQ
jgi:phosphatidylglycerophosphate synthase